MKVRSRATQHTPDRKLGPIGGPGRGLPSAGACAVPPTVAHAPRPRRAWHRAWVCSFVEYVPRRTATPALQARRLEDGVLIDLPLGSRSLYLLLRSHTPLRCHARAALPIVIATWPSTRKVEPPSSHHTLGGTSGASSEALAGSSHRQIERAAGPDAAVIDASVRRQLVATVG